MNQEMKLDQKIEAVLFMKGEPISIKKLSEFLDASKGDVEEALKVLEEKLSGRGLSLIFKEDSVMLGTHKEFGPILEKLRKDELSKELSKASLETLAIILYKEGATRSDIDYIRGVNSSFILRNMLIRGLIEKVPHPTDSRRFLYKPTFDLLGFLGVSNMSELPDFADMKNLLDKNAAEAEKEAQNEQI